MSFSADHCPPSSGLSPFHDLRILHVLIASAHTPVVVLIKRKLPNKVTKVVRWGWWVFLEASPHQPYRSLSPVTLPADWDRY